MPITQTKQWFEEAIKTPTLNAQRVQVGVHFEEVAEMLESISSNNTETNVYQTMITATCQSLHILANALKTQPEFGLVINDRKEFLDSILDQLVTATGSGHIYGMDVIGGLSEVNRSNYSKFVDDHAVFNEHGKIAKGPNYTKPVLDAFVGIDPVGQKA